MSDSVPAPDHLRHHRTVSSCLRHRPRDAAQINSKKAETSQTGRLSARGHLWAGWDTSPMGKLKVRSLTSILGVEIFSQGGHLRVDLGLVRVRVFVFPLECEGAADGA